MRPDQCGNGGRRLTGADLAAVHEFEQFLRNRKTATAHIAAVATIAAGLATRQLRSAPPYAVGDLVKVVDAEFAGRWGQVASIQDYRDQPGGGSPRGMPFLIMVNLLTSHREKIVPVYPGAVPFEPYELALLHGGAGDWIRDGRVASFRNWPAARTGVSEAS